MPRKRAATHSKRSPFSIVLLLVEILLLKLGSLPLYLTSTLVKNFQFLIFNLKSIFNVLILKTFRNLFIKNSLEIGNFKFEIHIPLTAILIFMAIGICIYTFLTFQLPRMLPDPRTLQNPSKPLTTEFYDRNGTLLYRFHGDQDRSLVKLTKLPPTLIQATIAIEDKNFYQHPGVDVTAIARAIHANFTKGELQGASTITQQLVKNTLLTPEKTYSRKIKEVLISFWAESIYSKQQILEMYLNQTPYGGTTWGVEAASLNYFNKHASELNLSESAFLAGLPAAPINPRERQKKVLDRMVAEGFITSNQAQTAYDQPLNIQAPTAQIKAPHFVRYVVDHLNEQFGAKIVSEGGLKVITTLDLELQGQVQEIVKSEVDKLAGLNVGNGAAMVQDGKTGQILVMVGSKDYYDSSFGNFNVTTSLRNPGSSIKVITYATAFKQGFSPATTVLDIPAKFPDGDKPYIPVNYDGKFHGPISIRIALGSSYNIPAVKILDSVGITNMLSTAHDLGITTLNDPSQYGLSLTLGGGGVKLIDMMTVYGTLSQNGIYQQPTPILRVSDSYDNILAEYQNTSKEVLQPEIAYLITHILADNNARSPAFGPSSLLNIPGFQVAVKTGTSDSKRDNWTFGYTPGYVVGVWVGNNDNSPMNPSLTSGITGAAPIWNRIMVNLLRDTKPVAFERPAGIIEVNGNGRRDLAISGILPKSLVKFKKEADKLTFTDPYTTYATDSATIAN